MPLVPLNAMYQPAPGDGAPRAQLPQAQVARFNPLASPSPVRELLEHDIATPLVIWSGWLGDEPGSDTGVIEPDFRNWSGQGRRLLDKAIDELLGDAPPGSRVPPLWMRPHHRHILSDGPSCAAFVRAHDRAVAEGGLALLFDLDLLMTPDMSGRREDHAVRLVESAGALGRGVAGLVMPASDWEGRPGALAREVLDAGTLRLAPRAD